MPMNHKKNGSKTKKVKTLTISSELHSEVKKFCAKNEINIGQWVEDVLSKEMDKDVSKTL